VAGAGNHVARFETGFLRADGQSGIQTASDCCTLPLNYLPPPLSFLSGVIFLD
jgi:hypothetical protein